MNIHFQQAEKKSQALFYIFVTVAFLSAMMVLLSASPWAEIHISIPASSGRGVALVNSSIPAVVPAPPPPSAQLQVSTPVPSSMPSSLPQAVPAPVPDLQ